jgi:hypothetical protein
VLTAWGRQAVLDSIDDPLVQQFLDTYMKTPTTRTRRLVLRRSVCAKPAQQPGRLICCAGSSRAELEVTEHVAG